MRTRLDTASPTSSSPPSSTPPPTPNPTHQAASGAAPDRVGFDDFYRHHFLPEHQHAANRALHMAGTLAGLVWLPLALWSPLPWLVLLFPVVHAAPGLVGHRLFERNAQVGDMRVLRKDFSPLWFIAANHRLTFEWVGRGWARVVGRG